MAEKRVWLGNSSLRRMTVPLGELQTHPRNPRRGVVAEIAKSLDRFGQQRPILALPDGTVVAGNHTLRAVESLGWTHVAAIRSDLTEGEIEAYLVADNRTAELGDNDAALLADILKQQYDAGKLEGTGYTPDDYEDVLADLDRISATDPDMSGRDLAETPEELADRQKRRAETYQIREVILVFTDEQYEKFGGYVKMLRKEYGKDGVMETVFEAVERAARAL